MKKNILNKLLKRNFTNNQVIKFQKFLSTQGIIIKKKNSPKFNFGKYRTIYLTLLSSTLIILIAFLIPVFSNMSTNIATTPKIKKKRKLMKAWI